MTPQDNQLEIRSLVEGERDGLAQLYQNAFRRDRATAKSWAEMTTLNNTVALFESERLVSALTVHPFECYIGGKPQALGGIGGVVTGADSQGRGYAGKIMQGALEMMRDRCQAISTLYPFSFRFYKALGWGRACRTQRYENIRQDQIIRYQEGRLVRMIDPKTDIEALAAFHDEMMSFYNLTFTRSEDKWREIINGLIDSNTFLYVIVDNGELIGYFDCQNFARPRASIVSSNEHESFTRRMAMRDETAIRAMMGFFSRLPGHVKNLIIQTPADIDLHDYMIEPSPLRLVEEQQARIVIFKEAVQQRGYAPDANARLTIHITDEQCEWNNGVWEIDVDEGHAAVQRVEEEPMIGATIDAFTQIFCGYKAVSTLADHGDVHAWDETSLEICNELFLDQPTFTQDWF